MNVALFASAFYPHFGGVEEHVRQLAHVYQGMGLSPIVVTNRWPRSLPAYEEYEGIRVHRLPFRVPEGSLKARANYHFTHASIVRDMLNILKTADTTLLHVHCVSSNGHYALLAKNALKLPLVVTTHGERTMDADHIYEKSAFLNKTLCTLLTEADHVTACSQSTLDDIQVYFGQPFGSRASVVYNGINLADFADAKAYPHSKPYILGIGRQVSQKGFDILIKAFAHANLDTHDLLLAGDGSEHAALEQLIEKLGQQNKVKFLGRTDRETTVSLFHGCSFFVLPSRLEPFGIVNLEAMAAGKAVIASHVGGVPEIVLDRKTGLLVPCEDVPALAKAIAHVAADTELQRSLGAAGKKRAQAFDWPYIADQYIQIYSKARKAHAL